MLKIKDKKGKLKYVLSDTDDEPVSVDELILKDQTVKSENEENKKDK